MKDTATTETERISIRDLYASPDKIAEQLKHAGQLVLTNNDNPMAVMCNVDSSTLEDTLTDLRRMRVQKIMESAQASAFENGTSNMTLEEINAEIAAMRAEKKPDKPRLALDTNIFVSAFRQPFIFLSFQLPFRGFFLPGLSPAQCASLRVHSFFIIIVHRHITCYFYLHPIEAVMNIFANML
ncbi:MAG: hypothetical protein FWH01_16975 [Oscillospiraceae bacterium]|nr:hypothetical protein [Oscillospiraceae bacterium]